MAERSSSEMLNDNTVEFHTAEFYQRGREGERGMQFTHGWTVTARLNGLEKYSEMWLIIKGGSDINLIGEYEGLP